MSILEKLKLIQRKNLQKCSKWSWKHLPKVQILLVLIFFFTIRLLKYQQKSERWYLSRYFLSKHNTPLFFSYPVRFTLNFVLNNFIFLDEKKKSSLLLLELFCVQFDKYKKCFIETRAWFSLFHKIHFWMNYPIFFIFL